MNEYQLSEETIKKLLSFLLEKYIEKGLLNETGGMQPNIRGKIS